MIPSCDDLYKGNVYIGYTDNAYWYVFYDLLECEIKELYQLTTGTIRYDSFTDNEWVRVAQSDYDRGCRFLKLNRFSIHQFNTMKTRYDESK